MNEQGRFSALQTWFSSPQGQEIQRAFVDELVSAQYTWKGDCLLQIGSCGANHWLNEFTYRAKWILGMTRSSDLIATANALPFERDSLDCIIAPLTTEIFGNTHHLLSEFDRVLRPMGYLVFLGINPWSFWGASLRWGRLSCFARPAARFSSSLSLKHAMLNHGYRQCFLSSFYYLPPVGSEFWLHKLEFLNQMSKMIWPYPAGFYCLVLQKYSPCVTPLPKVLATGHLRLAQI